MTTATGAQHWEVALKFQDFDELRHSLDVHNLEGKGVSGSRKKTSTRNIREWIKLRDEINDGITPSNHKQLKQRDLVYLHLYLAASHSRSFNYCGIPFTDSGFTHPDKAVIRTLLKAGMLSSDGETGQLTVTDLGLNKLRDLRLEPK
ncbi:hypothetical protein [Prosthecomicrobium hirschii]|uniref:hypothetical protein n=1 Tax=Prosthecodimorpha hirschii TaxID=665126 RepID=UPI00221F1816|nr:hypothetical protein [Prosthecomicrobium hirschii]MCW1841256.1 hypothetical protein [Prosthecomicrobium hirschii]